MAATQRTGTYLNCYTNVYFTLKAYSHLLQQSVDSTVDCVNTDIGIFLSLSINVTVCHVFFKYGPTPASFLFSFSLFKQTIQFLQQINVKKCPSSIQCRDLNPRPFEHESSPITTRPGLPPTICHMLLCQNAASV